MIPSQALPNPATDAVLAATLQLLCQCATGQACAGQRKTVFECLKWLGRQEALDPGLRDACRDAAVQWVKWQLRNLDAMQELLGDTPSLQ